MEHDFHWMKLLRDVSTLLSRFFSRCHTCQVSKGQLQNIGLYTLLRIPSAPWEDVRMVFLLGLMHTLYEVSTIFSSLWIGSRRWHILSLVIRRLLPLMLTTSAIRRWSV